VSPPWFTESFIQGHSRNCSRDCHQRAEKRRCNRGSVTTGGLRPPALVRAPFARRRNCDFSDVQTNNQRQERRA